MAEEGGRAANLFGVKLSTGMVAETVRRQLAERRIHVAVRGGSVRVSPHVYSCESDLDKFTEALADALSR